MAEIEAVARYESFRELFKDLARADYDFTSRIPSAREFGPETELEVKVFHTPRYSNYPPVFTLLVRKSTDHYDAIPDNILKFEEFQRTAKERRLKEKFGLN